jgi:hypothetical protein
VAISDPTRQFASAVTRIDRRPWPYPPSGAHHPRALCLITTNQALEHTYHSGVCLFFTDFPRFIARELTSIIERRRVCGLVSAHTPYRAPHIFEETVFSSPISRVVENGSYLAYVYLIQVVGWPLLPNGLPGERCREVKSLIQHAYLYGMVSHRKVVTVSASLSTISCSISTKSNGLASENVKRGLYDIIT